MLVLETSLSPSLPLKDLSKPYGARLEFKPNSSPTLSSTNQSGASFLLSI